MWNTQTSAVFKALSPGWVEGLAETWGALLEHADCNIEWSLFGMSSVHTIHDWWFVKSRQRSRFWDWTIWEDWKCFQVRQPLHISPTCLFCTFSALTGPGIKFPTCLQLVEHHYSKVHMTSKQLICCRKKINLVCHASSVCHHQYLRPLSVAHPSHLNSQLLYSHSVHMKLCNLLLGHPYALKPHMMQQPKWRLPTPFKYFPAWETSCHNSAPGSGLQCATHDLNTGSITVQSKHGTVSRLLQQQPWCRNWTETTVTQTLAHSTTLDFEVNMPKVRLFNRGCWH